MNGKAAGLKMTKLTKIISKGEDSRTQFKLRFDSVDAIACEICAMANSEGGIIAEK